MQQKHLFKKNAFTLAEILITLVILGTLITLTSSRLLRQTPDIDKTRFKKAYAVTEQTVQKLVNNDVLYPGYKILKNTEPVITTAGDQFGTQDENAKFREAFKYYLSIVKDNLECDIYQNGHSNKCFMTNDGVVYGIADTDFENIGVVEFNLPSSTVSGASTGALPVQSNIKEAYTPITVYTSWQKQKDISKDAFVIGVRYDGKIKIMNNENCASPKDLRCKAEEYLESEDIKANSD